MRISPAVIALSAVASLMASSASAAVMVATWTSTITRVGAAPAFGPELEGTPFVMTFTYDTANAQTVGEVTTLNDGLISAKARYDDRVFDIDVSKASWEFSQGLGQDGKAFASFGLFANLPGMGFIMSQFNTAQLDRAPVDMSQAFSATLEGQGAYTVLTRSVGFMFDLEGTDGHPGTLVVERQATGAVPEPATWALMISGFGLAGATLRRRRALAA